MAAREQMGQNIQPSLVDRVAAGMRFAITGVGPDNWFGPMQPLQPQAQDKVEGRQFDYPVGYNLRLQPRSEEAIGFPALRGLADGYDLMRLIIETRKDQVGAFEWKIVPKDPDASADSFADQIKAATGFLEKPDRENDWSEWLRLMVEDLLVIDTICVYPRMNKGGKLYSLDLVDGATIKRLIDDDGRTPMMPSPAYQQILKGIPAADYTTDELLYMMRNKRTWKIYGYSPVEQVMMTVNIALRRQMSQLQFYTEGNIPEAIAQLPKDWPVASVKDFQAWWDSLMEGNTAQRRKMKFIPNLEGILFPKKDILKDEYDEWLARICCFAFSIAPTPFIKQNNRATGEQAADTAKEEGLLPLLTWLQNKLSMLVQGPMGFPNLAFRWDMQLKMDPLTQAQVDTVYLGGAGKPSVITPDEVRERLGYDALTPAQKEELNPTPPPPVVPPPSVAEHGAAPGEKPAAPPAPTNQNKGAQAEQQPAEKLHKAQRQVTAVGKYVAANQPALQKNIAAVLQKKGAALAAKLRKTKLLHKDDSSDDTDPLIAQLIAEMDASGVAASVVDQVTPEMLKAFKAAGIKGVLEVNMDATQDIVSHMDEAAHDYAAGRSAQLVKGIDDTTLSDLRNVLAAGVKSGASADDLADSIESMGAFGEARAATIARTELAYAHVQGNVEGWKQSGETVRKRSILGDLHDIDDECDDCADAGVVDMDADFVEGFDFPPYHPNCICDVAPVLGGEEE
jgi:hypothetical protein